jgi:hypothetical protein
MRLQFLGGARGPRDWKDANAVPWQNMFHISNWSALSERVALKIATDAYFYSLGLLNLVNLLK